MRRPPALKQAVFVTNTRNITGPRYNCSVAVVTKTGGID
ncbi:uncharacterized protein METZ01_LOCUS276840 [marine metagenome]|uniref:Uncharacterized protein n=1 Tax=marine metagenome TaxID=408172 RepID=A0A382KIM2_9ZZZZ